MPKLAGAPKKRPLTPQREAFARHIVVGYSAAECYRRSYQVKPTTKAQTIAQEAYKLLENPDIALRVAELREKAAVRAIVTRESMIAEMDANRTVALDMGKIGVAENASMHRARVAGLLDRERGAPGNADDAAALVKDQVDAVTANLFELGRRVYFTLEQGKRRAQLPAPKPKE